MANNELSTIEECDELLARHPDSWRGLARKAQLLEAGGEPAAALAVYRQILAAFPEQGIGLRKALELSHATAQWREFLTLVPQAREVFPDRPFWEPWYIDALREDGQLDELDQLEELVEADQSCEILLLELAERLKDVGRQTEAEEVLRSRLLERPDSRKVFTSLAAILRSQYRFDDLVQAAESVIAHLPDADWATRIKIAALIQADRTAEAVAHCEEILADQGDAEWAVGSLCWALLKRRDWEGLLAAAETPGDTDQFLKYRTRALAELGRWTEGRELLLAAFDRQDGVASAAQVLGEHAELRDQWADALRWWSHPEIEEPLRSLHIANSLMQLHRGDEAVSVSLEIIEHYPNDVSGYLSLARIASFENRNDEAVSLWQRANTLFPGRREIVEQLLFALQTTSQWDAALQVLEEFVASGQASTTWHTMRRADFHAHRYEFQQAFDLLDTLFEGPDVASGLHALLVAASLSRKTQNDRSRLERYRRQLEQVSTKSLALRVSLVEQLIALGEFEEALERIDRMIDADASSRSGLKLRSWAAAFRNEPEEAKRLSEGWLKLVYRRTVHSPAPNLHQVTTGFEVRRGETVVLAAMRDEQIRIVDFLEHHRRLGVRGFYIVDNCSTDGTAEILAEQADVKLFTTDDDYVLGGSGMRWINQLISELSVDCWCLFLDADELFVYPGCEDNDVSSLTAYLDGKGFDAMSGFMLDMHPEAMSKQADYVPGESLIAHSRYFTNTYDFQPFVLSPYTDVRGGFRPSVLGEMFRQQTKCPLVRSTAGIRFLSSSHETTASVIADVTSALLHFKFVGDSVSRAVKETEWTSSAYYANRADGQTALQARKERDGDVHFLTEHAVEYESSAQLLDLGLLRAPVGFLTLPS